MICFNDAELNAHYSKEESMDQRREIARQELDGDSLSPYCDRLVEYCRDFEGGLISLEKLGQNLLNAYRFAIDEAAENMEV